MELEDVISGTYTITNGIIDVDGNVNLFLKGLTEIPFVFGRVTGNFSCFNNKLTSLDGCPKEVLGNFNCSYNNLTSLLGSSKEVGGYFYCSSNNLTSLIGGPESVGGDFYCSENNLTRLDSCPKEIWGKIFCNGNPVKEIYNLCPTTKFVRYLNELSVIRSNNVIIGVRLEDALYCSDGDDSLVRGLKLKNYRIVWD